jgi:hypothetical protein
MAAVMASDSGSHFRPSSELRRSHSQTGFGTQTKNCSPSSASGLRRSPAIDTSQSIGDVFSSSSPHVYTGSLPSSAPSSPRAMHSESTDLSCASTPTSNLSFPSDFDDTLAVNDSDDEEFGYPSFLPNKLFIHPEIHPDDNLEPPPSPRTGDSYTVSPADHDSDTTSRPDSPDFSEHAEDDTAVTAKPSRQVDYLSHDWREEDIWSSWRYIVSRRGEYANSARLENASWRTWMKAKNNLRTISPETLNWLKDCDVTWLYGPLQCSSSCWSTNDTGSCSTALSKSHSLVNFEKKPILKKRTMSELMLRKSLSSASLLKQATAAVQAQESRSALRPHYGRSNTDYATLGVSRRMSYGTNTSVSRSTGTSECTSPGTERKHIHFNEQVEQCIAVDVKGYDDEMDIDAFGDEDSDSADSGVMMKSSKTKKRMPAARRRRRRKTVAAEGKTIAKLPSTTLKYREDTPEPPETAMKHSTQYRSSFLSTSSSQETLRPTKHANQFFFGEEDDHEMDDGLMGPGIHTGWRSPPAESSPPSLHRSASSTSLDDEPAGMRRTPSGMFMPYEEGETSTGGEGIFGRVIDSVNTARDIAHVIWNVGWRK